MTSILIYKVNNIELCPFIVKMLFIFIVVFPLLVFIGFYVLLWFKAEVLFSPSENAWAEHIRKMDSKEILENQKAKDAQYGVSLQIVEGQEKQRKPYVPHTSFLEGEILNQYIAKYAPFLQKNIKVETRNGIRYFDAYANWNGCHFVIEVKQLHKWTPASLQGVRQFASNARDSFSYLHMTLLLKIDDDYSADEIAKTIHQEDTALNIIFVSVASDTIKFSEIF